jgi:type I restriction enzyme S subunit
VGEIGEYVNGRGFRKTEWADAGRPIIRIQNLTGSGSGFNYFDGQLEDRYVVPPGALLVSWSATLGVYRWAGPEGALNQHIFRVRSYINEDFHRYVLEHVLHLMQEHTHGSGMVHITRDRFDSTPIPVPPVGEQERIVTAIEEAFSKLDAGEAGLRSVRQLLKRMRDAILAAAVTGHLVPQDPTDTPATKLLVDLGVEPIEPEHVAALPAGWVWATVGEMGTVDLGRQRHPDWHTGSNMRPYLRVANVFEDRIDSTDLKEMHFDVDAYERFRLREGDLLLNEGQTPELLGRPAIYRGDPSNVAFTNSLLRFRALEGIDPEWALLVFRHYMRSGRFTRESRITTNIAHLSAARFKSIEFPVPPTAEQHRVVLEVARQLSDLEACERTVDVGLKRSGALRRSVLKAAFEGRLVPQDPTDEPASVLLERIRAEREAVPKAKTRRARSMA